MHSDIDWLLGQTDPEQALAEGVYLTHRSEIEAVPMADRVMTAALDFISLRDRVTNPKGRFDRAGRFYPASSELCACCKAIRPPSAAWPYSLMVHCRTAEHVAARHGVDPSDVRRQARALGKSRKQAA